MIKMKKVLSLVLAFVMTASLFANWPMPVFATEGGEPPVVEATAEPTAEPTVEPTIVPTAEPTVEPTVVPTAEPTVEPTVEPVVEKPAEPSLYDKLMAMKTQDEIVYAISQISDEEFATLSSEQIAEIEAHYDKLGPVRTYKGDTVVSGDETVDGTSEIRHLTYDFTDAAPFKAPVEGKKALLWSLRNSMLPADEPTETDNGLETKKTVSKPDANGKYTLTLEAWATGESFSTTVTEEIPTDIILVLDQSGSMKDAFDTVTKSSYKALNNNNMENYPLRQNGGSDNLWYQLSGDSFVRVNMRITQNTDNITWTTCITNHLGFGDVLWNSDMVEWSDQGVLYQLLDDGTYARCYVTGGILSGGYTYYYADGTSEHVNVGKNPTQVAKDRFFYASSGVTNTYEYFYIDGDGNEVTIETSEGDNTKPTKTYYSLVTTSQDRTKLQALKDAVTQFSNSVKAKAAATGVNHRIAVVGFASGNNWNGQSYNYGNTEVFIGANQHKYGTAAKGVYKEAFMDMDVAADVAQVEASIGALDANGGTLVNLGVEMANGIFAANPIPSGEKRNRVVIVFTDGQPGWSGYDSTIANSAITQTTTSKNTYGATVYTVGIFEGANVNGTDNTNTFMRKLSSGTGYYLTASNATALNNIFQTISDNIQSGGSSITLGKEAVVKDVISDQFTLPKDADISDIKVYTANYTAADTFTNKTAYNATVAISSDKKTISVTNFDFAENWVGTETTNGNVTYHGKKLIIEIPVKVRDGFLGGNNVLTNGAGSGVYENADAAEPLEGFVSPKVDVEIGEVKVTAPDWNVYLLGSVSADEIEDSLTVTVGGKALNMKADNYGLANWQTAYVSFDEQAGYNNLVEDKNFTATFTVTPKETGTVKAKSGSATAKINVFKPEVTFNDVNAYQGASVPVLENLQDSVVWKHDDKLSTAVTMTGTEPRLNHTYTPAKSGVITGTEDIKVDVTTKIGENDVTTHVTYSDKPVIYVFSPEVTYKDLGVYLGNALPTDEQLATAVEKVEWKNETLGAAKAADMGDAPVLTHTFGYKDTIESVNTNADIPVNDIIKAGETTITPFAVLHTNCGGKDTEERAADCEFELHVLTPVITFQDSQIQLGHTPVYENENLVRVEWTHPEFADTAIGDKPTLGYKYSPAADAFTVDTPVKVTVNVGSTDITGFVKFYRDACSLNGCTNTTKTEVSATDGNRVNFVVHIKCADLTITKQAGENTVFAENETFMFKVTGPNNYSTIVVIEGAGSAIIKNLPVGTYTVTELTDWSWRYTVDDAKKECDLSSPNGRYVTFTNTISNPYWLDGNDYKENVFNQ